MFTWLVECPHCGYVANSLDEKLEIPEEFLKSDEYITCEGNEFISKVARRFYKRFLIQRELQDAMKCFLNLHRCAWSCDDNEDPLAERIRLLAMPYLDEVIGQEPKDKDAYLLIKADFLRRTSQFDKVIEEFGKVKFEDERYGQIIGFQIQKAEEKDTNCYTGQDVFDE